MARSKRGVTQRQLAAAAQVPQSTVARIEAGSMQPTLPVLYRLLAAAGLEPRLRLETYDDTTLFSIGSPSGSRATGASGAGAR